MPISFENVVEYNLLIKDGRFQQNREHALRTLLDREPISTIANACSIAYAIALNQYFINGNHRTAILTIYLKLIEEADLVTRKPAYLIYAYLDEALYRREFALASNYDDFERFIGNGGFIQIKDTNKRQDYIDKYRREKIEEVNKLSKQIKQLVKSPNKPKSGIPWTEEVKVQLKRDNVLYHRLDNARKKFTTIKHGDKTHWADAAPPRGQNN